MNRSQNIGRYFDLALQGQQSAAWGGGELPISLRDIEKCNKTYKLLNFIKHKLNIIQLELNIIEYGFKR